MGRRGFEARCYYNTATFADPQFVLAKGIRELTLDLEKGEADDSGRESAWERKLSTLFKAGVTFKLRNKPTATFFGMVQASFLDRTPIDLAIMDGEIDELDSRGLHAEFEVSKFSRSENPDEAMDYDVTLILPDTDSEPEWLTIGT